MNIQIGQIVMSLMGHDKGDFQVVLSFEDKFLFLSDGKRRKMEAPKKKKLKHVALTKTVLAPECLKTNRQIRNALSKYRHETLLTEVL